ncbi:putative metal-dependent hydrolase [Mucilaginibacter sp. RS28]|uniref:Metal-dependent hydrolase n=1 Tax=Mucilaginibacter straminoryzae TaxID=2932774 RepID=A0A9X1X611_9SPHI|nr:putative metal-dependent hydrolase [Mucilaginibacter straminoryzae]MCJ8211777.1 putative metal-dependent hydrolase [Mucilaginibacter straminoryzae]
MEETLKYPVGKFVAPLSYTDEDFRNWIAEIKALPGLVRAAVIGLNEHQLNTPYRPGGWTVKQVVHHLADSHMNALMRFKLALTEENPTIKPYDEPAWALLPDYRLPVESSLKMLEGIHQHLGALFESLTEEQWDRTFFHPQHQSSVPLKRNLAIYAWHGRHHLAHITSTFNG